MYLLCTFLRTQTDPVSETLFCLEYRKTDEDEKAAVPGIILPSNTMFKHSVSFVKKQKQTPWSESASELYRPSDRRLSPK
jgi:hypothetical protein